MSHLATFLILVSAAFAQTAPRALPDRPTTRKIEYSAIQISNRGEESPVSCGAFKEPDAKDTPNPVLANGAYVQVDMIVAWDGNVYSPLVEETDGAVSGATALRIVKSWRFRPATCNGSPINTEVRIKFRR